MPKEKVVVHSEKHLMPSERRYRNLQQLPGCTVEPVRIQAGREYLPACLGGVSTTGCVGGALCEDIKWGGSGADTEDLLATLHKDTTVFVRN